MLNTLQTLAAPAAMRRLTLLLNHVLASETVATQRLMPHAGRVVSVQLADLPALLPPVPTMAFRVTAAGLLEWCGDDLPGSIEMPPDLRLTVDASNPARMLLQGLGGQRPRIDIAGDAALAGDMNWLIDNLRWDLQDDLARVIGDVPARTLGRVAGWCSAALREAAALAVRVVPGAAPGEGHAPPGRPL